MNTIILIKLIAAHLTGDFLLQSDKMCADKFSKNPSEKYKALIGHALIQAVLRSEEHTSELQSQR